ncbi:MAG: hypothetical protein JO334_00980 [Verrucomicrobia bacterium]|nr:hypothetical protein [Verrucomicrobiota bacterium]
MIGSAGGCKPPGSRLVAVCVLRWSGRTVAPASIRMFTVLALQAAVCQFSDRWRSEQFGNKVDLVKETLRGWAYDPIER